jgi:hypothetical protein
MNKTEVSKYLRLSTKKVSYLFNRNILPGIKTNYGNFYVSKDRLDKFLNFNTEYSYKKLGFGSLRKYIKSLILK